MTVLNSKRTRLILVQDGKVLVLHWVHPNDIESFAKEHGASVGEQILVALDMAKLITQWL